MTSKESIIADLASEMNIEQLFQKHVVDGNSFFFRDFLNEGDKEYQLRYDLASALNISINDIVIVGSAKLGFSVKNENFVKFDGKFEIEPKNKNKSDIDIAIVSRRLFDNQTELIFELSRHFSPAWIREKWLRNSFYPTDTHGKNRSPDLFFNYTKYIARGWLRPDFSPNLYIDQIPWRPVLDDWYKQLRRRITVGLYSDWYYLKHYQMDNLINLRVKTQKLEINK